MREVKFRAWVSDDDENFFMCRDVTGYDSYIHLVSNKGYNYYNFELMQYTGLKDKNGVEIYEGDIVRTDIGTNYESILKVEYCQTAASDDMGIDTIGFRVNEYDEVIGNIYENPELIKKDLV